MSTFSSANITDGNLVLKERTHRIKTKYSMHQYSVRLHNLGNWLMIRAALTCSAMHEQGGMIQLVFAANGHLPTDLHIYI